MYDFITWHLWRKWVTPYVPKCHPFYSFEDRADLFCNGLFDWDEVWVSPCSYNFGKNNSGKGTWTPYIKFIAMPDLDRKDINNED